MMKVSQAVDKVIALIPEDKVNLLTKLKELRAEKNIDDPNERSQNELRLYLLTAPEVRIPFSEEWQLEVAMITGRHERKFLEVHCTTPSLRAKYLK